MNRTSDLEIVAQAIMTWWRSLYPDAETGRRGDAGARASMRRAGSAYEILLLPAGHDLLARLRDRGVSPRGLDDAFLRRIAVAAAVICERRDDRAGPKFAEVLGSAPDEERPRLSALRFQSLMAAMGRADDAEQLTVLRRALALAKDAPFDVRRFVRDLLAFSDATRIDWTFDYFGTRREAPATDPETEENPS